MTPSRSIQNPQGSKNRRDTFHAGTIISILACLLLFKVVFQGASTEAIRINSVSSNLASGASHAQPFSILGATFPRNGAILLKDLRTEKLLTKTYFEFKSSSEIAIRPIFTTLPATWPVTVMDSDGRSSKPFQFEVETPAMTPRIDPVRVPFIAECAIKPRNFSNFFERSGVFVTYLFVKTQKPLTPS